MRTALNYTNATQMRITRISTIDGEPSPHPPIARQAGASPWASDPPVQNSSPKSCNKCGGQKTPYKNARYKGGFQWQCKPCTTARQREILGRKEFVKADPFCHVHGVDKSATVRSSGNTRYRCLKCMSEARALRMTNPSYREKVSEQVKSYAEKNVETVRKIKNKWKKANPDRSRQDASNRRAAKKDRLCSWADQSKIRVKFLEAKWMTEHTGILHCVDHFYPLRGESVSGFHCEKNLRVIPASMNLKKSNHCPTIERLPL